MRCLDALLAQDMHRVVAVCTANYPGMVDDDICCDDFVVRCREKGIFCLCEDRLYGADVLDRLRDFSPDVGLSIGWRRLVREPLISVPRLGFVNLHASDLPRYRGFASTSWAILNGDPYTAMTAHEMVDGVADEGRIYLKKRVELSADTTIGTLFAQFEELLPPMVMELLDGLEEGTLTPVPQDESACVMSYPRLPNDGWIDWSRSAVEIDRLVRSVSEPYPGAFTSWRGQKLTVWKGRVAAAVRPFVGVPGHVVAYGEDNSAHILTGDGIYVAETVELDDLGERRGPAEVIKGMRQRLGLTPGMLFEMLRSGRIT